MVKWLMIRYLIQSLLIKMGFAHGQSAMVFCIRKRKSNASTRQHLPSLIPRVYYTLISKVSITPLRDYVGSWMGPLIENNDGGGWIFFTTEDVDALRHAPYKFGGTFRDKRSNSPLDWSRVLLGYDCWYAVFQIELLLGGRLHTSCVDLYAHGGKLLRFVWKDYDGCELDLERNDDYQNFANDRNMSTRS